MTFTVLALICSTALSHAECQPPTAHDVFVIESGVQNELACMRDFTLGIAKVAAMIPEGYYPKVKCERVPDERI